jgi:diguanylate cyclase (GGDEF)-like protein
VVIEAEAVPVPTRRLHRFVDRPIRTAWSAWPSLLALGLGAVAIAGYYQFPRAGWLQAIVFCLANGSAPLAAAYAVWHSHGGARRVWIWLGAAMTLSTLANVPYYFYPLVTGRSLPFPSVVDALWLLTYPCFVMALFVLFRLCRRIADIGDLFDAAIIIMAGGLVLWVFIVDPVLDATVLSGLAHLVSVCYPSADLPLFAMLVMLLVSWRGNPALRAVAGSFVALLTADMIYSVQLQHGSYAYGGPADAFWMASYLLITVAALHPAARTMPVQASRAKQWVGMGRLVVVGAAITVGPVLLAAHRNDIVFLTGWSITLGLVVLTRMAWGNRLLADAQHDIAEKTGELRHQALHDALTGLPNRALIVDRIEQMQARNSRFGTAGAALFVDLDGFKKVNDTLGHLAGDRLLQAVAERMSESLRDVDTIGRLGGDEFIVLIEYAPAAIGVPERIAERVLEFMRRPFDVGEAAGPVMITPSIGIAGQPRDSAGELLRDADVALYQAKAAGKNCYQVFEPEMEAALQRSYQLELDLRTALSTGEFFLMYQPIYDLADVDVIGFEALLRWQHPAEGLIGPNEFIPILEASGQIVEVGRWVLEQACAQIGHWRTDDHPLYVTVNVSGRQLDRDEIVTEIAAALEHSALDPSALTIEVTETALVQHLDATCRRLRAIRALGVRVAIDDFGTGYSSLAYLQQLPIDCLKIDRCFTSAIGRSNDSETLVHTLVQLGKTLGLTTLAEGVETVAQMNYLRAERVDAVQGFLLAKPLAVDAVTELLAAVPRT